MRTSYYVEWWLSLRRLVLQDNQVSDSKIMRHVVNWLEFLWLVESNTQCCVKLTWCLPCDCSEYSLQRLAQWLWYINGSLTTPLVAVVAGGCKIRVGVWALQGILVTDLCFKLLLSNPHVQFQTCMRLHAVQQPDCGRFWFMGKVT